MRIILIALLVCVVSIASVSATARYVRKNQASLTDEEVTRFVNAILKLKEKGIYDQFVRVHMLTFIGSRSNQFVIDECNNNKDNSSPHCFDWAHGGPHFLPWHRKFLLTFENELKKVDPNVSLVYWDWTVDNSTNPSINRLFSPLFMGNTGNPDNHHFVSSGPFANWPLKFDGEGSPTLQRQFGGNPEFTLNHEVTLPVASNLDDTLSNSLFDQPPYLTRHNVSLIPTFRKTLEGFPAMPGWDLSWGGYLHARVHSFIAGSMLSGSSPNDPLFMLHHTNIDRIWSKWTKLHPEQPMYLPKGGAVKGINPEDYMIPWDGVHDTDDYDWYFQFEDIIPRGSTVQIKDMLVDDTDLGYVYEGLEYK